MLRYIQKYLEDFDGGFVIDGILIRDKMEDFAPEQPDNNPAENGNQARYAI